MSFAKERRRDFLRRAGLTALGAGAVSRWGAPGVMAGAPAGGPAVAAREARSYAGGNFFLILNGIQCGFVKSVEGGGVSAEVINEAAGPSYFVKKHIGQPKYEDFALQIDFRLAKSIYDWIAASWMMDVSRKSGSIVAADYKLEAQSEREFHNALITETTIPAMDGSSKDPAYMTIKISPEYTRASKASGKLAAQMSKAEQKLWLPSNFKLEIDGLDCSRVNKVDSFTVKQTIASAQTGESRDYQKEPGKLEFPNLKITLSEVSADSWRDWHEDFVIKGNNDESREKNGMLIFLTPNLKQELGRINFFHLGIFRLGDDQSEANPDQIKRVTAELYCERMEFRYNPQAVA